MVKTLQCCPSLLGSFTRHSGLSSPAAISGLFSGTCAAASHTRISPLSSSVFSQCALGHTESSATRRTHRRAHSLSQVRPGPQNRLPWEGAASTMGLSPEVPGSETTLTPKISYVYYAQGQRTHLVANCSTRVRHSTSTEQMLAEGATRSTLALLNRRQTTD